MHADELLTVDPMTAMMNAVKYECWSCDLRLLCLHDGGGRRKVDHGAFVLYLSFLSTSCSEERRRQIAGPIELSKLYRTS